MVLCGNKIVALWHSKICHNQHYEKKLIHSVDCIAPPSLPQATTILRVVAIVILEPVSGTCELPEANPDPFFHFC